MRVLVTGGAGFIGSHIVDLLLAQGNTPLVVDDLSSGKRSNLPDDVELVVMDIRDPQLIEVADSFRPDAISHCAAQASVARMRSGPDLCPCSGTSIHW